MGELQHYYVSPGSYLWTQGLHNCVDYAFFLFVGIVTKVRLEVELNSRGEVLSLTDLSYLYGAHKALPRGPA